MGKRYLCDFCDRSFADNATSRKNHLKGVHHQRMRKLHYDAFRDAATILSEESVKKPCRNFLTFGKCDYGPNCKYSHLTQEEKNELAIQINAKSSVATHTYVDDVASSYVPSLEDWLSKRAKQPQKRVTPTVTFPQYVLPPCLLNIPNLPPSVLPPPPEVFYTLSPKEWG